MSAIPWILISIVLLLVVLLAIVFIFKKRWKNTQTDYYTFFVLGVTWLPMGILFMIFFPDSGIGIFFTAIGAIYTILGLAHKKEWKKKKISKEEKKKLIISIVVGLLVLLGIVAYYFVRGSA